MNLCGPVSNTNKILIKYSRCPRDGNPVLCYIRKLYNAIEPRNAFSSVTAANIPISVSLKSLQLVLNSHLPGNIVFSPAHEVACFTAQMKTWCATMVPSQASLISYRSILFFWRSTVRKAKIYREKGLSSRDPSNSLEERGNSDPSPED